MTRAPTERRPIDPEESDRILAAVVALEHLPTEAKGMDTQISVSARGAVHVATRGPGGWDWFDLGGCRLRSWEWAEVCELAEGLIADDWPEAS